MALYYAQQKYKCKKTESGEQKKIVIALGGWVNSMSCLTCSRGDFYWLWVSNSIPIVWLTQGFQKLKGILK